MHSSLPYLCLLFNAMVWGLAWWPFQTMHAQGLAAPWATGMIYSVLAMGTMLCFRDSLRQLLAHPVLWLLALSCGLTNVSFNTAASTGDVVRVILLFYLMPAWSVLLAWKFLGERPTPQRLWRLVLAFVGMALVIVPPDASWHSMTQGLGLPEYLALWGGMCFAMSNVILRRSLHTPACARMLSMFAGCTIIGLGSASMAYTFGPLPGIPAANVVWLGCAAGMTVLVACATWAWQHGAARIATSTTALIMLSEVLFATGSAWLLGATALTPRMLLGGALIVGSALLAAWQGRRSRS